VSGGTVRAEGTDGVALEVVGARTIAPQSSELGALDEQEWTPRLSPRLVDQPIRLIEVGIPRLLWLTVEGQTPDPVPRDQRAALEDLRPARLRGDDGLVSDS
jgi:hypothetical protein